MRNQAAFPGGFFYGRSMTETVNNAVIKVKADASEVEAGLRPAIDAAKNAERAIAGVGNGSQFSARAQQSLIRAIERTTIQMQAGSRAGSQYYEILARQRGVDPAVLEPYLRQLRELEEAQRRAAAGAEQSSGRMEKAYAALRGGAVVAILAAMIAPVVSAQREFDKLNASLVTATGSSEKAAEAFAALQVFATETPFGLNESTEAFIKMRNLGLDPSERALRSYGNTAAAMGKDLNQMVEAVADAATGEFERLKEFGIKANQESGKVSLTFKGTTTTIANNATEIEKYLMRLGEVDFTGAMAQRAATLDGAISQLGDSWDSTMRSISNAGGGDAAIDVVAGLSGALANLESILNAVSEAADKQNDKLNAATAIQAVLTTAFEAFGVIGINVAYVFTQIGKEIVGIGKQAQAVASLDFAKARAIGEQMKAEAKRDREEVDRQSAAILGAVENAKKAVATKGAPRTDALAQFRIQREAERESDTAAKQREAQYRREAAALAELAGLSASFADDWKMLSTLYGKGAISLDQLTKAQADLLAKQPAMKAAAEQEAAALKARADFQDAYSRGLEATSGVYAKRVQDAQDEATRNEELARTYGMTKSAVEQLELARLEGQLAQRSALGLTLDEIETLEKLIDAKKRNSVAISAMEQVDAAKKAAEEWKRASDSIEQSLTDALLRGFESGNGFGKNFVETMKNMFSTLVLRPVISAVVSPLAASLTNTLGLGGAAGAAGAGATGLAGAMSGVSNLYGLATGGATLAGGLGTGFLGSLAGGLNGAGIGSGLTSALGMNIGNGIASVVGPNIASGIASGLSGLAAAAPWVAGALAVVSIGKAAFGRGPKEYSGEQTLNGSLGAGGFTGTMDADWVKKGGWFRSDKKGTDRNPVGAEFASGLTSAYDAIKASSADFAEVLGLNAASIATRSQTIKIALGKDEAANQAAIAEFFAGVANTVAAELLPEIGKFQAQGEQASATLQRLAVNFSAVDQILLAMGTSSQVAFRAVGAESIAARERLVALAGGIDALATQTTFFNENFLSLAERVAIIQGPLNEQLAKLGFAGITTAEQFKEAAQGLASSGALATEDGAKVYTQLLALGPQYKLVSDYLKEASDTAAEAAATLAANILQERSRLQDELDSLTLTSAQQLERQRAALDESNRALFDQVQVLTQRKGLQEQLDRLTLSSAELLARQRAALDESNGALFDQIQLETRAKVVRDERKGLQDELDQLTMSSAQLLAKQRAALDESNRAIFDQIQAAKAQKTAAEEAAAALKAAQEKAQATIQSYGDALLGAMERAKDAAKALRDFNDSLLLGNLSALDPDERYREAKRQFEAADPADTQAAQAFLQASKDRGADDFYYQRDFAAVQAKIAQAIVKADRYVETLPSFLGLVRDSFSTPAPAPVRLPASPPPIAAMMARSSASTSSAQADVARVEEKVDRLIEKLGGTMEVIADSTSKLADQFDRVTEGGNGMVNA